MQKKERETKECSLFSIITANHKTQYGMSFQNINGFICMLLRASAKLGHSIARACSRIPMAKCERTIQLVIL